jgi:hypothetical protein
MRRSVCTGAQAGWLTGTVPGRRLIIPGVTYGWRAQHDSERLGLHFWVVRRRQHGTYFAGGRRLDLAWTRTSPGLFDGK